MIASTLIESEQPHARTDFFLHHLPERFAAASDRAEKNDHVVHAAAESGADQDPKRARKKPKLRRQHRPNERARPGDRSEMMTENHPAICRNKILSIFMRDRGRGALIVQDQDLRCQPFAVEAIADREGAKPRDDDPQRADLFAAGKREHDDRPWPKAATPIHSSFFHALMR